MIMKKNCRAMSGALLIGALSLSLLTGCHLNISAKPSEDGKSVNIEVRDESSENDTVEPTENSSEEPILATETTEETEEIFRKCYSMYNSKKTIFDEIINRGHRLGVLQNKIDEAQTEINNIQAKVEKYKKLYKMTIKPTNYEKFHYTWNSIVDDDEPKKAKRIKKTEEFILGYLLENDKLFNKIVVARKLMGKGV